MGGSRETSLYKQGSFCDVECEGVFIYIIVQSQNILEKGHYLILTLAQLA